jgi:hypothetical protein
MYSKPLWYDTVKNFPPPNVGGLDIKLTRDKKHVPSIEEKLIKVLLRKVPVLKLEWADSADIYHIPIRQKFIERQIELMKVNEFTKPVKENELHCFRQTLAEFDGVIKKFEQEMVDCRGDVITKTRRGLAGFIKEREAYLNFARFKCSQHFILISFRTKLSSVLYLCGFTPESFICIMHEIT